MKHNASKVSASDCLKEAAQVKVYFLSRTDEKNMKIGKVQRW